MFQRDERILQRGIKLCFIEKDISQKIIGASINLGGKDRYFFKDGEKVIMPEGSAHFLEHMMFYKEDGYMYYNFIKGGSYVNALTNYNGTIVYASANHNFYTILKDIIKYIFSKPVFSEENISKEFSVIESEIDNNRSEDEYDFLLKEFYKNIKNHEDLGAGILGTVDSIKNIDASLLESIYDYYYKPENIKLYIAGKDLKKEEIISSINKEISIYEKLEKNKSNKKFVNKNDCKRKNCEKACSYSRKDKSIIGFISTTVEDNFIEKELVFRILLSFLPKIMMKVLPINKMDYITCKVYKDYGFIVSFWNIDKSKLDNISLYIDSLDFNKYTDEIKDIVEKFQFRIENMFDSIEVLFLTIIQKDFYGVYIEDYFKVIKNMKLEDCTKLLKKIANSTTLRIV